MGSLTQVSKAEVGQVLKPGVTQVDLGIKTQRRVWVPILGLGSKTLKGRQRNLCLERGGVPMRGWEEEVPPRYSITDEVLSCSLQVLP